MRNAHRKLTSLRILTHRVAFVLVFAASASAVTIGDQLPTAKLIWVRGSTIMYSPIKGWSEQAVTAGNRPRWSPDGTRILYDTNGDVWTMNADFTGKTKVLVDADTADWFVDENAFTAIAADGYRVLKHDLTTGTTTTLYDARDAGWNGQKVSQGAELRTGGRYLLLFRITPGHATFIADLQAKVYISNAQMDRGDCSPAWARDGSYILNTARTSNRPVLRADFNASAGTIGSSYLFYGLTTGENFYIHGQRLSFDQK